MAAGGIFQLMLAQQEAEERKAARQESTALTLLNMEMTLLDRQIERNEKRFDIVFKDFETTKKEYEDTTGLIYKLPEQDRGDGVIDVLNDIKGGTADSLSNLLTDITTDTQNLQTAKIDMERKIGKSKLISDFYKGYGHDMSRGDPERWDIEDFSEEALTEYMAQYPELKDVDQQAFYKGVKTREEAGLFENIQALNVLIDQTKTASLKAATDQLEYDTKVANLPASQIEADIDTIDSGVHSMLSGNAQYLNTSVFAPAIQAITDYAILKDEGEGESTKGVEAKGAQDDALKAIGVFVTGVDPNLGGLPQDVSDFYNDENLRLGGALVLGNSNYINSIKGHLAGTGDLDYIGYVNSLQEIQMYAEQAKSSLESGKMTVEEYLSYKNDLEQIVGTDLNSFASEMDVVIQASEQVETKGKELAIAGMKDGLREYIPKVEYDIPEDYLPVNIPVDSSNIILPGDSSNVLLPDSTVISTDATIVGTGTEIDDPALKALEQVGTMTGAEFDYDATYFQGRNRAALRAMRFPTHIDPNVAVGSEEGQISNEKHLKNQLNSIIGSVVRMKTYGMGDEATVLDAKIKDGRVVVKITPGKLHPGTWGGPGGDIYFEDLDVISLQRAPTGMPTAFRSGVPYYYDPMEDKYIIQSNRLKD